MATLVVHSGVDAGETFLLDQDLSVIGRDTTCAVRLNDGRISRAHAEIRRDGPDTFMLCDRGSVNGTLLNGRRIQDWEMLHDGDEVRIGNCVLRFVLRGVVSQAPKYAPADGETIVDRMDTQELPPLTGQGAGGAVEALRFLLNLARAAEETDSPEELAAVLAEDLAPSIEASRVLLFIGHDENMKPVARELPAHLARVYEQPYSSSILRQVVHERVAVMSRTGEDERFKDAASIKELEITSAICVPILVGDEMLGAIYLDRLGESEPFTANNLELATAAGLQCSMALLNLRRIQELRESRDQAERELTGPAGFIGESAVLKRVYDFIQRVAPTEAGVLITGESGTGKELVARAIHRQSPRSERPFVIVNCAALAESLAEAELFGHERGAFTGAEKARPGRFLAADGGTIFLDEVGELSEPIQAKLLRVLESGEITPVGEAGVRHIDVRVVAATNRDLAREVEEGRFRQDLYYRLNILSVELPPLRERGEDVRVLVEHFLDFFAKRLTRPGLTVEKKALEACLAYHWPGNVRELKNAMERMVILARGETITVDDLPPEVIGRAASPAATGGGVLRSLSDVERDHIAAVLAHTGGNKKKAAEILQIDRSTLYAKLKVYDIGM